MTDAVIIAFVKEVLLNDPEFLAKYGKKFTEMQHASPAIESSVADFSDALESPLSPPLVERQAASSWVPKPVPLVATVPTKRPAFVAAAAKSSIVSKTIDTAAPAPVPSEKPALVAAAAKPSIVPKTIDTATSAPVPTKSIVQSTIESPNDPIDMDTSVPCSNPPSDSEGSSSDASSSKDDIQLVTSGGKRKKKAKTSQANKAKKSVASSKTPTPSTSTALAAQARRPTSPNTPASASQKKQRPPPPVYIQDKAKWTGVSKMCVDRKINYTNAKACQNGIKVVVPTASDYRDLTRALRERNISFHTYTLPEDTPTRVVIRRIPKEISTDDVKEDLLAQSVPVSAVHRLHKARGGDLYDMVLVVCDPTEGHHPIFKIKSVCNLSGIQIEKPFRPTVVGQCHRCQLYGHSQRNCYAKPRCVKCLDEHSTSECPRPKDRSQCAEPPSCVLCGQSGHPANYRGCPKAPKISPKLAKRANARQLRESGPERIPSSQLPDRLAPQRPSPWNQLNHQKAFPALVASSSQPIPALMAMPIPAPTPAPATSVVPAAPQPAPQRTAVSQPAPQRTAVSQPAPQCTVAPATMQARPIPPTNTVKNPGVGPTILEAYSLFMTRAARAMSDELNATRGNDGQLKLSTRKAHEIFAAYKSITDALDAMDAIDD